MSLESDVAIEEVEELWGKDFFQECRMEAYELRKKLHAQHGFTLRAGVSEMPVNLVLSVAIARLLKNRELK